MTHPTFSPFTGSPCSSVTDEDTSMSMVESEVESDIHSEGASLQWCGYKIVADNIDKNISPSSRPTTQTMPKRLSTC